MKLGSIVCDACVVLNLVATGQEARLLRALGAGIVVPPKARAEVLFLDASGASGATLTVTGAPAARQDTGGGHFPARRTRGLRWD